MIDHVLKVICDTGVLNATLFGDSPSVVPSTKFLTPGISLLIGAFAQHETLELYHFHIVYDTVNFTGVSVAIAMAIVFKEPRAVLHRGMLLSIFMALYIGFIVLFGVKLQSWDDDTQGAAIEVMRYPEKIQHIHIPTIFISQSPLFGSF
ncbi:putative ABC transmembrane type-1 domain-containing protein [Seiridium cardinale]|uniref:ABC transmembrane type-1 domain-containing protein n=1 Tax=Seiridium cardinale TaxID=138064 RepID=A0ABR2X8J5_9PEZI